MFSHPDTNFKFTEPVNDTNGGMFLFDSHTVKAGQSSDIGPVIKSAEHTIEKPEISKLVEQALKANPYVDSSYIRVLARGSRITLCGRVRSWFQKEEAGRVAKQSSGNLNIINDIAISYYS